MRGIMSALLVSMVLGSGGCGQDPPPTAGGQPAGHWVQALQDHDARLRRKAAFKLGNLGTADAAVVPALTGALRDRDVGVRAEAALALLKIGPAAAEAVPAFRQAQRDRDARVRAYAARALEKIQGGN
jgi:HEAT repeat protein